MKRGFTLIELLAVIVILAIIALIATPIVLSIINETKESALLRSADFYIKALENQIMLENMKEGGNFNPNTCDIVDGVVTCEGKEINLEVDGEVPSSGSVTFEAGKVTSVSLEYPSGTVTRTDEGELVIGDASQVCKPIKDVAPKGVSAGDKYQCKVKDEMEEGFEDGYYFYVISKEDDGTTTLIMDRNINSDGTVSKKAIYEGEKEENGGIYNLVAWVNQDDYGILHPYDEVVCWEDDGCVLNDKGPITAMKFLYNATKDWTNIPALNYIYNDKEYQGTIEENISYTSFVSNDGVATITALSGNKTTIGTNDKPLRARMPIYSAVYDEESDIYLEKGDVSDLKPDESNKYLYYHLHLEGCYDNDADWNPVACEDAGYIEGVYEKEIENIDNIYGYWTLSSDANDSSHAWHVSYDGYVSRDSVAFENDYGVRPVINLKI